MLKITLLGALALVSVLAGHGLETSSSLAWLFAPAPSGHTYGAVR